MCDYVYTMYVYYILHISVCVYTAQKWKNGNLVGQERLIVIISVWAGSRSKITEVDYTHFSLLETSLKLIYKSE